MYNSLSLSNNVITKMSQSVLKQHKSQLKKITNSIKFDSVRFLKVGTLH
jgi:hypothetical protein